MKPRPTTRLAWRDRVIRKIVENTKTHAEPREFRKHGNGCRWETSLCFEDDTLNRELAQFPVLWNVEQGNLSISRSFSSRLLAGSMGRIRGVDAQAPGVTFRYQPETATTAFWHENQISYDTAGVHSNVHVPLPDWPENFPGPNAFARRAAKLWCIETWRPAEDNLLFNLDEVAP